MKRSRNCTTFKRYKIFPKIYDFIRNELNYFYIIESINGPDLSKYFRFSNNIDKYIAYRLGLEIILNLKILYYKGFIHVVIK